MVAAQHRLVGEKLYAHIQTQFLGAQMNGVVLVGPSCEAVKSIAAVYDCVFGEGYVSDYLKNDIIGHANGAREAVDWNTYPDGGEPVEVYTRRLVKQRGVESLQQDRATGMYRLLWMKRSLDFIVEFLRNGFLDMLSEPMYNSAMTAYNAVLQPYHGYMVSTIVSMAFRLCPTRENLMCQLGFDDLQTAQKTLKPFLDACAPVVKKLHEVILSADCDFPDKV